MPCVAVPRMVEFCRGRWERLERAQGPACASMGSVGEDSHEADRPSGDTLRFAVVTGLLHADELDALGETLAAEVSELSGRGVTYVSDSAFDYAPSCTGAYVPELRDGDWSVMVLGGEEGGSLDVSRLGRTEFAYVAEFSGHRPASWQRAARALHLDDADFGMGGSGRHLHHPAASAVRVQQLRPPTFGGYHVACHRGRGREMPPLGDHRSGGLSLRDWRTGASDAAQAAVGCLRRRGCALFRSWSPSTLEAGQSRRPR
jgi:hypothetical protein